MKTIIQQEIERQELEKHRAILACDDRKVDRIDEIITVLESLLEPEKEQYVNVYREGVLDYCSGKFDITSVIAPIKIRQDALARFNEQFKPE